VHHLVVFQYDRVLFFNGLRGKAPSYLEYDSAQKVSLDELAEDYESWKQHLGIAAAAAGDSAGRIPTEVQERGSQALPPSAERFRFDRLLGRGGMGEVWLAYDETLKRQVAIKRVRREMFGHGDIDRRFLQEARGAARLSHTHIVPILSIDSDGQGPYLVLEYMEGGSLRQLLRQGHLQLPVALAYLRQLLQALQHAHQQGLIHRDVKPENILLSRAGLPKLADFGLAWYFQEYDDASASHGADASEGTRA
jgi:serine/threonine protein kinase